jgi:hypothetical protein
MGLAGVCGSFVSSVAEVGTVASAPKLSIASPLVDDAFRLEPPRARVGGRV